MHQDLSAGQALVSVIVPTYNRTRYLREALQSAVKQTYVAVEIIVSDDASSDDVAGVVNALGDPRIHYRRNETNQGMRANFLLAMRAARGKYIATLHDDDAWEEGFLESLVLPLEEDDDLVVAFSDFAVIDEESRIDQRASSEMTHRWRRDQLAEGTHRPFCRIGLVWNSVPMAMGAVIRRDAIDWSDFPIGVGTTYDLWLTYLACRTGRGAYYNPGRLTRYRVHGASETGQGRLRVDRGQIYCYGRFLGDPRLRDLAKDFRRLRGLSQVDLGMKLLRTGHVRQARPCLWAGLRQAPTPRTAAAAGLSLLPPRLVTRLLTR